MKAVTARELNLDYGKCHILKGISVDVSCGEFVIVIGPNGSGKTSLIRALAGLVKISGGIEILGRPLADYSRKEFAVAVSVVPQQVPVDFPFTVAETVLMGRSPHLGILQGEGENDHRIAGEAMAFTDITHLADRRLNELSGGEKQRVIIARAICQESEVILLDEPTASLDPAHQVRIMDLMERLRKEKGVTVIMVSHDLNLAAMYGDRLVLMKDGMISVSGKPEEVLLADLLEKNYGCRMIVEKGSGGEILRVFPVPGQNN